MLTYVTGNQNKVETARRYLEPFGIEITNQKADIVEIQSGDIEEVSRDKAAKAFDILKTPLFVNDSGWSIPALNGFPGPLMAYIAKWFTPQDFINLMNGKEDRRIILTEVVTYTDGKIFKVFSHSKEGRILDHPMGEGNPADCVVTFREDGKSIAQVQIEGIKAIQKGSLWEDFGQWLKETDLR